MSFLSDAFGKRLRSLRKAAGYNQQTFGEAIGVETATVSRWETGEFLPGEDKFEPILKTLKVTAKEFQSGVVNDHEATPTLDDALSLLEAYRTAIPGTRQQVRILLGLAQSESPEALLSEIESASLPPKAASKPKLNR